MCFRSHAWPSAAAGRRHRIQAVDGALGAVRIQRDALLQLQSDASVPLHGQQQRGDAWGDVLRYSELRAAAHHPQPASIHQRQHPPAAAQPWGSQRQPGAPRADRRGRSVITCILMLHSESFTHTTVDSKQEKDILLVFLGFGCSIRLTFILMLY